MSVIINTKQITFLIAVVMVFRHSEAGIKFSFIASLSNSRLRFEALVYGVVTIHYRFQRNGRMTRVCLDECIRRALKLAYELRLDVNKG